MKQSSPPMGALGALTDGELLRHAGRGAQEAMAVLYDRYQGRMYGLALRITSDPTTAQDVVQDALVAVWRNATRFDPERGSAASWMLAIVHHRAVDAVRRRRPTGQTEADAPLPAALVVPDIWGEVRQRLDAAVVREALARLAPLQREALELAYFKGLTQQEIAARTGAPLGTVKSRVRLGLEALRTEIEAMERAPSPALPEGGGVA